MRLLFTLITLFICSRKVLADFTEERAEVLDNDGRYSVHWSIDYENELVLFNVTCETLGFVGFGISRNGGMTGADIVIGGILPNGLVYFSDRYGTGLVEPEIDASQDWIFHGGFENASHTHLQFSRKFETCDDNDVPFTNDTTNFIWAIGTTDTIEYHGASNRGTVSVNILDPVLPPLDTSKYKQFQLTHNMTMPSQDTTYWCKILKSPAFTSKHHFVAFDSFLETPEAKKHTHHYSIFKCEAPEGADPDQFFEPYLGQPGGECYVGEEPPVPIYNCQAIMFTSAIGGKTFILPDNVGYPVGEIRVHEYYMLEIHYDNPEEKEGLYFETGATVYYTEELRSIDAGVMLVGHQASISMTVPPSTEEFKIVSHCSPECSAMHFPPSGVDVFAVLLHSHLSGRKGRLRLFRDNEEQPWIANDDNYDFEYQQTRLLKQTVKLLPGDQLATECIYSSTWTEGAVTGGLSSRNEMCEHFVWYYPKIDLTYCVSVLPLDTILGQFGIEEISADFYNPIVVKPDHLANMTYLEVVSDVVDWTPELREEWQQKMLTTSQENFCGGLSFPSSYPELADEYVPPNQCPN